MNPECEWENLPLHSPYDLWVNRDRETRTDRVLYKQTTTCRHPLTLSKTNKSIPEYLFWSLSLSKSSTVRSGFWITFSMCTETLSRHNTGVDTNEGNLHWAIGKSLVLFLVCDLKHDTDKRKRWVDYWEKVKRDNKCGVGVRFILILVLLLSYYLFFHIRFF